jgi:hypothetical protein
VNNLLFIFEVLCPIHSFRLIFIIIMMDLFSQVQLAILNYNFIVFLMLTRSLISYPYIFFLFYMILTQILLNIKFIINANLIVNTIFSQQIKFKYLNFLK